RTGIPLPFDNVSLNISNKPGITLGMVPVSSADFIYDYILQYPNVTIFRIEFTTVEGPPKNYRYQIWLNSTLMTNNSDVFSEQVLAFQREINEAIVSYASGKSATSPASAIFNINLKDWPMVSQTQLVLNRIVTEKEAKLKDSLVMMGLKVEVKIFLDITKLSLGNLKWKNLYEKVDDKFLPSYNNLKPDVSAPIQSWYLLLMNIAFYAILTWYFDKVIPDEYGGNRKSPLFFLTPRVEVDSEEDEDVANERNLAFNPEHDAALRICNLRKVYKKSVAVKDLCLTLKESNCLVLLGQNGAGKSTTINIISGAARATSGDALLYGCSVKDEIGKIRTMMGVCPQHDILFNDLTAREHIELYAGIKNIPAEEIQKLVDERLASVRLAKVADKLAGGFSGSMKRRLSTIIATIGDPKILLPTTGMDPVHRRHVWSFIENFKRGRVIILTTHSMEEADVLGDHICVMAHGSLRAHGNPIRLKRKFGSGYRVSLVTRIEDIARLKRLMKKRIPEAILEDDSAGSLLYELPNSALPKLPTLINWFEENEEKSYGEPDMKLLKAWGISQKSLEEVFLRL
ncbi:5302_t:CDS:2, partial [Funneliformis mosseae]